MSNQLTFWDKSHIRGYNTIGEVCSLLSKLLLAMLLVFAVYGPALAQSNGKKVQIRVTTGPYQIFGWEKGLINRDANLAHWTWMPITGQTYGRIVRGPAKSNIMQPLTLKYTKPIHLATVVGKRSKANSYVHVPMPVNQQISSTLWQGDVSCKLSQSEQISTSTNTQLRVRDRSSSSASTYGTLISSRTSAMIEHKDVFGVIEHKDVFGVIKR